ncbi:MAG: PAS domain-containing protein [Kiloniellales bacterium]
MSPRDRALHLLAGTPATGRAFLDIAAEALALGLGCPWAGFGRPCSDGKSAEVLVLWNQGRLGEGFRYDLAGTPCEVPYRRDRADPYWFCPEGVCRRFSGPPVLFQIKAESYRSEAIFGCDGSLVGHVFAINNVPEQEDADSQDFFRLVARRAGAEYERLLAELALQQSEARNRSIVENLPDLVCRFQPDSTLTFVNQSFCRAMGLSCDELLGHSFFEWVPEGEHRLLWDNMNSITRDHPESSYENKLILPGGELRWLRWTDRGLFDDHGELIELYSIGRDITEEKMALDALREREALISLTMDMVPALIAYIGPDYRYRFVNKAYQDWFGMPQHAVVSASLAEVLGEVAFNQVRPYVDRALAGETLTYERRLYYKNDHSRLVRCHYRPHRGKSGRIHGYVALVQDITQEKQAEDALRESELLVRSTTDMVPALIAHIGPDMRYRFVNRAYEDWFGKPRESVIGKSVAEAMTPEIFATVRPHVERALGGEPVLFESVLEVKNDERRHVRIQYQPRVTEDGRPGGFVSLVQDISDLVRAARDLQQAKETAERINSAKSRFLAAASHDLRQPLHALRLLLAALPGAPDAERRSDIIAKMGLGVDSMGNMLDSLLDVSELEAGTIAPEITEFPVDGLFRLAASNFGLRAKAKGLDFRLVPCSAVLRSDPALLARIIENFLSNAVRYTERGKLLIGCRRRGRALRIEVWDSGIGIPQDQLGEIFKEFHQLDNAARDRSKGLGLGLSIASRMAEMLGHTIDVQSRPGAGSMFAVTVPLGRASEISSEAAAPLVPARNLQGASILVIENDPEVREATRELLSDWGASVAAAGSCAEAVESARRAPPDLVLADYRLPGSGFGIDAIQQIRALCKAPVAAVVVTGDTGPEQLKRIESIGYPVLIKPVDAERLRATIASQLDARASAA